MLCIHHVYLKNFYWAGIDGKVFWFNYWSKKYLSKDDNKFLIYS